MKLSSVDRLCYITLLCLASASDEQGTVFDCDEESILRLTHLYDDPYNDDDEYRRAKGCLERYERNGMVTIDRYEGGMDVTINAFLCRQNSSLTNAERQARFRARQRANKPESERNNCQRNESNDRPVTKITNREEKNRGDKKREDIDALRKRFERFWEIYPRKAGKKKAEELWLRLTPSEELTQRILAAVEAHKKTPQWTKDGGQFIPHATTFLNQERWNDVVEQQQEAVPSFKSFKPV